MLRYLISFLFLLSVCQLPALDAASFKERLTIAPQFRGAWMLSGFSKDGGKTLERVHPTQELAVVSATQIRVVANAATVRAVTVVEGVNDNGGYSNLIKADTGKIFAVSAIKGSNLCMVQLIDGDKEEFRALFTVE